jgi:hypothetical protein
MVHERQGLALGLEPGYHLFGVQAQLDDLECHLTADRLDLLGYPHAAHTTLADLLQQFVTPYSIAGLFAASLRYMGDNYGFRRGSWGCLRCSACSKEAFNNPLPQLSILTASLIEAGSPVLGGQFECRLKNDFLALVRAVRCLQWLSHDC